MRRFALPLVLATLAPAQMVSLTDRSGRPMPLVEGEVVHEALA